MRVISFNANGIRAAAKKGFFDWVLKQDAEVICIQETKAQEIDLPENIIKLKGYDAYFSDAEKKGYSGVAIYTKNKPSHITKRLGFPCADTEGRYVQATFGDLKVASLYLPSGSAGETRQAMKFVFLDEFKKKLKEIIESRENFILCGDWNIAHKIIDIKNWRANQKHSGFLPEERAWFDDVVAMGFVDAFRVLNHEAHEYTWWSQRGRARANNVGWRIDYQMVTPSLRDKIKRVEIYREQIFSDHAPLIIDYNFELTL